jgi:hypothetical protein
MGRVGAVTSEGQCRAISPVVGQRGRAPQRGGRTVRRPALLIACALAPQLSRPDSAGPTPPAVRALVDTAARRNFEARPHRVQTVAETEIALVAYRASGRREIVSVQQQASVIDWTRDSIAEQHIIGYRADQVGMQFAMTRAYRVGWIVPLLQGDRIQLRLADPASVSKVEKTLDPVVRQIRRVLAEPETLATVHPLARDGGQFYEYPRADSLRELTPEGDSIDLIRVAVTPRRDVTAGTSVFEGEVDLDARSLLLVRLRGRVAIVRSRSVKALDVVSNHARVVGFIDMWNGPERDGVRLPNVERLDIVSGGVAGSWSTVLRFVTRFRRDTVIARDNPRSTSAPRSTLRYRVTYAPLDSQAAHHDWMLQIGAATDIAQRQSLDDTYPDRMQPNGPPLWSVRARNSYDVFRFNKVEGLYTGLTVGWRARDLMPGLAVAGSLGYAWSEQTVRGYFGPGLRRGRWGTTVAVARLLDLTNDFRSPFDSGGVWMPLLWSSDDYDYVDRHVARVAVERLLTQSGTYMRLEVGAARDAETVQHRAKGWLFGPFRPNRVVEPGRYVRTIVEVEWNPDVRADLTRERFGGGVRYERGDGDLDYQRAEAVLVARHDLGRVLLIARLFGGAASSTVPTQQLFEIGGQQNLPGYEYKAFAGDRAWTARGTARYGIPILRSPFPLVAGFVIPAIAPELNFGVQTGMAWASDDAARNAVRRLGDQVDENTGDVLIDPQTGEPVPVSVPTKNLRATTSLGLRALSGAVYIGVALPIDATRDTQRGLRLVFGFGRDW